MNLDFEFGFSNGTISEYVFTSPISGTDYMLSRLDWDLNFVKYFGLSADVVFCKYFYVGISGRIGIPGASGNMQDYDWMNVEVTGHDKEWYDNHYWLTNYSKHDNQLTKYLDGTVKLGGVIPLPFDINILPFLSFQAQEFAFDGVNGYKQYVPTDSQESQKWSDTISKDPFYGKVISYDQQRIFIFLGVKIYTTLFSKLYLEIEGKFSPFTMIGAIDNHHLTNYDFLDQPKGLGTWGVSGKIEYSLEKLFKFGISADYLFVPVLRGATYEKHSSASSWSIISGTGGGASSSVFSFSVMATLFF